MRLWEICGPFSDDQLTFRNPQNGSAGRCDLLINDTFTEIWNGNCAKLEGGECENPMTESWSQDWNGGGEVGGRAGGGLDKIKIL